MTCINTAALLEKVTNCDWAFIIDDTVRCIDELKAKLRYHCLDRDFIDGAIGWKSRNNVTKRDNFAQLRRYSSHTIMQTPEEVHSMSHEGIRIVDRHRSTSDHTNFRILKRSA